MLCISVDLGAKQSRKSDQQLLTGYEQAVFRNCKREEGGGRRGNAQRSALNAQQNPRQARAFLFERFLCGEGSHGV
ncbi:MAG TPA: hypothetical protein P5026_11955, partial [Kiritimatiellia bacterium]|nr:hypothetical protein [Kiritimatiellia bacterium]